MMPRLPLAALLALALTASGAHAQPAATDLNCATTGAPGPGNGTYNPNVAPNGHIAWPADDPVWEFDFLRPGNTITPDGTGLEIRDVYYNGRMVMKRGNVPVLNVEYDPGVGCGCFRDWQDREVRFEADGVVTLPDGGGECFAQSTAGEVRTTCEKNEEPACDVSDDGDPDCGGDVGSFNGVAVEDYGDELVLTMHTEAGWYRYRMKWHFYLDGRIWPEYSFSAARAACTQADHRHHAYWRFDFDLEGTPGDDVVSEIDAAGNRRVFTQEADRTWGDRESGIYWEVADGATGTRYEIVPSDEDLKLPVDAFSKTDALVLKYDALEFDDGSPGCAIDYGPMQNGEDLAGEDIVFWYRSSALHVGGNPWECDIVGPTLRPRGAIVSAEPSAPAGYRLQTAGPNPFTPFTSVRFRTPEAAPVRLVLLDALGREVRTLFDGEVAGGRDTTVRVDGSFLPSGTYTVRMTSGAHVQSTRVVLVR